MFYHLLPDYEYILTLGLKPLVQYFYQLSNIIIHPFFNYINFLCHYSQLFFVFLNFLHTIFSFFFTISQLYFIHDHTQNTNILEIPKFHIKFYIKHINPY